MAFYTSQLTGAYTNQVWQNWSSSTTGYTTASTTIWQQWMSTATPLYYLDPPPVNVRQPTEEELRIAEERREQERVAARERAAQWAEATAKSFELLESLLDEKQGELFSKTGEFTVHTRDGKRTYLLSKNRPPTLIKSEDKVRYSFCIHPRQSFPKGDELAALKLLLETDEREFLRIANATQLASAA